MQVNVSVQLADGETFGPSQETAAKAILKACGGTLATDTCSLYIQQPAAPVVVGTGATATPEEPGTKD